MKADKLPTLEQREEIKNEEEEIKEEEESSPTSRPLDWMFTGTDAALLAAHRRNQQRKRRAFFDAQGRLQPLTSLSLEDAAAILAPPEPDA